MKSQFLFGIVCVLGLVMAGTCHGDTVSITNHSFEGGASGDGPPAANGWNNNAPDGWDATGSYGLQDETPASSSFIDGTVFAFLESGATGDLTGGALTQDIGAVLAGGSVANGDVFTLTLAATSQNNSPSFDFDIRDNVDPLLGSSLIGGTVESGVVAGGGVWADYVVMGTVDTASSDVFLVLNTNGPQIRIDNVRLDIASAVPEPGTLGLLAIGLTALIGRRRR